MGNPIPFFGLGINNSTYTHFYVAVYRVYWNFWKCRNFRANRNNCFVVDHGWTVFISIFCFFYSCKSFVGQVDDKYAYKKNNIRTRWYRLYFNHLYCSWNFLRNIFNIILFLHVFHTKFGDQTSLNNQLWKFKILLHKIELVLRHEQF